MIDFFILFFVVLAVYRLELTIHSFVELFLTEVIYIVRGQVGLAVERVD
jgi:hypothetical protein